MSLANHYDSQTGYFSFINLELTQTPTKDNNILRVNESMSIKSIANYTGNEVLTVSGEFKSLLFNEPLDSSAHLLVQKSNLGNYYRLADIDYELLVQTNMDNFNVRMAFLDSCGNVIQNSKTFVYDSNNEPISSPNQFETMKIKGRNLLIEDNCYLCCIQVYSPDLSGNFTCQLKEASLDMTISKSLNNINNYILEYGVSVKDSSGNANIIAQLESEVNTLENEVNTLTDKIDNTGFICGGTIGADRFIAKSINNNIEYGFNVDTEPLNENGVISFVSTSTLGAGLYSNKLSPLDTPTQYASNEYDLYLQTVDNQGLHQIYMKPNGDLILPSDLDMSQGQINASVLSSSLFTQYTDTNQNLKCLTGFTADSGNNYAIENQIGDVEISSQLDMKNNKIVNINTPVNNTDCANKQYVDESISHIEINNPTFDSLTVNGNETINNGVLSLNSSTINMNNNRITNLSTPSSNYDAVTKEYVDTHQGITKNSNFVVDLSNGIPMIYPLFGDTQNVTTQLKQAYINTNTGGIGQRLDAKLGLYTANDLQMILLQTALDGGNNPSSQINMNGDSTLFYLGGSNTAELNFNNNNGVISGLKDPSNNYDAVNLDYFNKGPKTENYPVYFFSPEYAPSGMNELFTINTSDFDDSVFPNCKSYEVRVTIQIDNLQYFEPSQSVVVQIPSGDGSPLDIARLYGNSVALQSGNGTINYMNTISYYCDYGTLTSLSQLDISIIASSGIIIGATERPINVTMKIIPNYNNIQVQ